MIQLFQGGALAEWLRSGLQNRVHRFNSGRHLHFFIIVKNQEHDKYYFSSNFITGSFSFANLLAFFSKASIFS